jgi:hypothetical protein
MEAVFFCETLVPTYDTTWRCESSLVRKSHHVSGEIKLRFLGKRHHFAETDCPCLCP